MVATGWICPNCTEQHQSQFDVCWKCGTNVDGVIDPTFAIHDEAIIRDDAETNATDKPPPQSPQFPTLTYYSLPLLICAWSFGFATQEIPTRVGGRIPEISVTPFGITVYLLGFALVGIPLLAAVLRTAFRSFSSITRQTDPFDNMAALVMLCTIFRLPEQITDAHPWFVPVYYGSFVLIVLAPLGVIVWHIFRVF